MYVGPSKVVKKPNRATVRAVNG